MNQQNITVRFIVSGRQCTVNLIISERTPFPFVEWIDGDTVKPDCRIRVHADGSVSGLAFVGEGNTEPIFGNWS